jgi:IPT/TIG domain
MESDVSHRLNWTWIAPFALAICLALPGASLAAATPSPAEPACHSLQNDDNPTVTSVTRDVGPRRGGAMVTINGSGLQGATVRIGGKKAFVVSNSANKLVIVTPPGRRGRRDLVIRTPQGQRTTSSYTYL